MRVVVSGASGLIGSALVPALVGEGDPVTRLVRSPRQGGADTLRWDPDAGALDPARLDGIDAVVHLSGETVAGRWNEAKKTRIMESRRRSTRLLAETVARLERPPQVFVSASAVGYYGNGGAEPLTEESPAGEGFLAEVVREWEAATRPAAEAGTRVVNLRFGIVLSREGGALAQMLTPFRLGVGGPLGSGRQYMSWIAIDDVVGALRHALSTADLSGPVNASAPTPVTSKEFARTLGRVLRRPALLPVPPFALRVLFGEFADEGLLWSQRALPAKLTASGYSFHFPELEGALRQVLGN
jgi:uncharacterized protein (TIGR01777 family)